MKKFEKVEKTGIISTKFSLRCTLSLILGHTVMVSNMYMDMNKCRNFSEYGGLQADPEFSLYQLSSQLLSTRGSMHSKSISNLVGGSLTSTFLVTLKHCPAANSCSL